MEKFDQALSWVDKLQGLPAGGIVLTLCIAILWMRSKIKRHLFSDDMLPPVMMMFGAMIMMLLADARPTTMPHHVWIVRNFSIGAVIAAFAWAVNAYVLPKVLGFFSKESPKWEKPNEPNNSKPPQ